MRAIIASASGAILQEFEKPTLMPGNVLVKVKAAALNRADLAMMTGGAHGAIGGIGLPLGLEWAGEVTEIGPGVTSWRLGDRVMGASPAAFCEYTIANPDWIYAIPANLSFEQAAALPVAMQTMHDAIASNGSLAPGQSVLIQGASAAVGMMGMQVAKCLGASQVIGTSTSAKRLSRLADFGADLVVDSGASDWTALVQKATRRKGVDLLVDLIAGPLVNPGLAVTKIGGRMINVGRMAGSSGQFDFDLHSMRRITYVGVSFRTRTPAEISEVISLTKRDLMPALADGKLHMPVDSIYPLEDFASAFERMARNEHFGKIVLSFN